SAMSGVTRRSFLQQMGLLGLPALYAWDLLKEAPVHDLPRTSVGLRKQKIVVLGAGLAGMTCAYELQKLGYECVILEARERSGGRLHTIRGGSVSEEVTNGVLRADFDPGLYFNAGPSRIPHHHRLTLHYCRELDVPLEIYNNVNEAAWYFSESSGVAGGRKIRKKALHNDMRGHMMELLAKSVHADQLDRTLTAEDYEQFLMYVRAEGALDVTGSYKGSSRRGYDEPPGAGLQAGSWESPYALADLIREGFLGPDFYNVAEYVVELQQTMLQVQGGNDRIATALSAKLGNIIHHRCVVRELLNTERGVKVTYADGGGEKQLEGDYCICTLPLTVLTDVNHNLSSNMSRAIDKTVYIAAGKLGMQFKRRFWEEDEMIYGGITHTNNDLYQIFYPSNDYHSRKGILIGYYHFNERAEKAGELSYADRERLAFTKGKLVHPQYEQEYEGRSFSVSWHKTKYTLGGWAIYSQEERQRNYRYLLEPDKRVYLAGEHLSYLNGWMAGAFESARSVVTGLHNRVTGSSHPYPKVS
ncbi:MAG TPA: flavin monoamine oxidase family protein, partial [Verrucomicrobiae bacterium]|nr:flavin monoamine oxidase family protein [Verrucomicrobiae bacterium]